MKHLRLLLFGSIFALCTTACFEDNDDNIVLNSNALEVNDFVWKGMNVFYVYKDNIDDLANDRFTSDEDYTNYLNTFETPEQLFESLLYLPDNVDEFSSITSDYIALEQQLQGVSLNNGMDFGLVRIANTSSIFGFVRYVLPNSSAASQGVTRGMLFTGVDGTPLTDTNFGDLLFSDNTSYSIDLATYDTNGTPETSDDSISPNGNSITLTEEVITENPIFLTNTIETSGLKIGYLMYNGFRNSTNALTELNAVFANFRSENINELVLDLRYNGGGSVDTAIFLASMITGQFNEQPMFTEAWNSDFQAAFETENPEALVNRFTNQMIRRNTNGDVTFQQTINSLNLNKLYVLTTGSTASASELVINSLRAYIDVVQIGTDTRGKPQASTIIYDSENFQRENANINHTYAMLPLIYEAANADGFSDYYDGLAPTIGFELREDFSNLGTLGDVNEPLLKRAIDDITGVGRGFSISNNNTNFQIISQSDYLSKSSTEMIDSNVR